MRAARSLADAAGEEAGLGDSPDAVAAAAAALVAGSIVAIKGLGGYHLACRADDSAAVGALRSRKHREDRPFALMVEDFTAAAELVELGEGEADLLRSRDRPIVLPDGAGDPASPTESHPWSASWA